MDKNDKTIKEYELENLATSIDEINGIIEACKKSRKGKPKACKYITKKKINGYKVGWLLKWYHTEYGGDGKFYFCNSLNWCSVFGGNLWYKKNLDFETGGYTEEELNNKELFEPIREGQDYPLWSCYEHKEQRI